MRLTRFVSVVAVLLGLMSGSAAAATAINVGDGWHSFTWFGGNGAPIAQGPFTFTATSVSVVTVTDAFCAGDVFGVTEGGLPIGLNTSAVAVDLPCVPSVGSPDVALLERRYSHGRYFLLPGFHSIELTAVISPFGGGGAFVRVDHLFGP